MIEKINGFEPENLAARCLEQAVKRWPALYEATTKVLNALLRDDAPDLGRLFFSVLDHVLVELAFLNAKPYVSATSTLVEALRLEKQPPSLPELAAIAVEGAYTDHPRVERVVLAVLSELEELLVADGATLHVEELTLPRAGPWQRWRVIRRALRSRRAADARAERVLHERSHEPRRRGRTARRAGPHLRVVQPRAPAGRSPRRTPRRPWRSARS